MQWAARVRRGVRRVRLPAWRRSLLLVCAWLVVGVPVGVALFLGGSRTTVLAGHDAVVRPTLDGWATLDLGPYLPDVRYPTGGRLGARVDLGKTTADSYDALIQRYAFIASQPEGQIRKVRLSLRDLAVDSAVGGALGGLAGPGLVSLVGRRRWAELRRSGTVRRTAAVVTVLAVGGALITRPWAAPDEPVQQDTWQPLAEALPEVVVPGDARSLEIESGLITQGTRRLVASAVDTYERSVAFYSRLVEEAPTLAGRLRQPEEGDVVGLLVSDRHDNIGMDPVARAVADQGRATFLLDAGDDTSTGSSWEAFSLESLDEAFADYDERYAVAGNHDYGDFVSEQARQLGFTTLDGEVVDGPGGVRLLGVDDTRSSGLGTWRDERGIGFAEQEQRLADLACEHDEDGDRINMMLVHDANSGREALARGCVDVVLGGHLHQQLGPTEVTGGNGRRGYTYATGTAGGAAYAVAIGSKLRRPAGLTLVTVRDGRVLGLQPVAVDTTGRFTVSPFVELDLEPAEAESETTNGSGPAANPVSKPLGGRGGGGI